MITPEKKVLQELELFLEQRLEDSGAGRVVYEEILDEIGELKFDMSREYNTIIA